MNNDPPKNEPLAPGTMLQFPTHRQLAEFRKLREGGVISVFRARRCDACQGEVPEAYECCTPQCYDKLHPPKNPPP